MYNDIQDFKKLVEFLVEKYKDLTVSSKQIINLKLQLNEEKKYRAKCELLEFELKQQKVSFLNSD